MASTIRPEGDEKILLDLMTAIRDDILDQKEAGSRSLRNRSSRERSVQLEPVRAQFDKSKRLIELDLSGFGMREVPDLLGELKNIEYLDLSDNRIALAPPEALGLSNLKRLILSKNELRSLEVDPAKLTSLKVLDLAANNLRKVPQSVVDLPALVTLLLSDNEIESLPDRSNGLSRLETLDLRDNRIQVLPESFVRSNRLRELFVDRNFLTELPPGLLSSHAVQRIHTSHNQLKSFPAVPRVSRSLQELNISNNNISLLPTSIGKLRKLRRLNLSGNSISTLPPQIELLSSLEELYATDNSITSVPDNIGVLSSLTTLDLSRNRLTSLPETIGGLQGLKELRVSENRLGRLPGALGRLDKLTLLKLDGNDSLTVPPEILSSGTEGILTFLRGIEDEAVPRYESKLLLVGEGGTGKSSLLRLLKGLDFDPELSATHGIEVEEIQLEHPNEESQDITLNIWDFGGQQIYHATHQFFLTHRSVYVVVWNARLGEGQSRLDFWLETIRSLAPDSPVLLVATHADQCDPDLNYPVFKQSFPQVRAFLAVSNKTGAGSAEFRSALAEAAASLPMLGQLWARTWLTAEKDLLARDDHHIRLSEYIEICENNGVPSHVAIHNLSGFLHDLGKILHFSDDELLSDMIVLQPNWITKAISKILKDRETRERNGILEHSDLARIWPESEEGEVFERRLHPVFLRLMERFDLSYQITPSAGERSASRSLIPQLLPHEPPPAQWPPEGNSNSMAVRMLYQLSFLPAGIMSWFIVRSHPYTTDLHWRDGVLLEYKGHFAHVELNSLKSEISLETQGEHPYNFFMILMHTMDLILDRFEGLSVLRTVPCICQRDEDNLECSYRFSYDNLVRRVGTRHDRIQCEESFLYVSSAELLYGIHHRTDTQLYEELRDSQKRITGLIYSEAINRRRTERVLLQQTELAARNFTRLWNFELAKLEADCPGLFLISPPAGKQLDPSRLFNVKYRLQLLCQHPEAPHRVGKPYTLQKPREWWGQVTPWLRHLSNFLRYAIPVSTAEMSDELRSLAEEAKKAIELMRMFSHNLPSPLTVRDLGEKQESITDAAETATGPALRALHVYLEEVDSSREWGGLRRTVTLDGSILWLCPRHYLESKRREPAFIKA